MVRRSTSQHDTELRLRIASVSKVEKVANVGGFGSIRFEWASSRFGDCVVAVVRRGEASLVGKGGPRSSAAKGEEWNQHSRGRGKR
jgi:hypothetical protein